MSPDQNVHQMRATSNTTTWAKFNTFLANIPIFYLLKILENHSFLYPIEKWGKKLEHLPEIDKVKIEQLFFTMPLIFSKKYENPDFLHK